MASKTCRLDIGIALRSAVVLGALMSTFLIVCPSAAAAELRSVNIIGELHVFGGATLEVGLLVIRPHGIDAPELAPTCARPDGGTWPCGKPAAERPTVLLAAGGLACDALYRDRYGRLNARCIAGEQDVGARLMGEGLAQAFVE